MAESSPHGGNEEAGAPVEAGGGAPAGPVLLLTGARLADGRVVDVRIGGGRIEAVGVSGGAAPALGEDVRSVDLTGYLLLPAPAEPHAHLELAHTAGSPEAPSESFEVVLRRIVEAALEFLGNGATAVRTHVRVDALHGLGGVEAAVKARGLLFGLTKLQVVAVPRVLTGPSGADGRALLRDALKLGADVVGGCPDLDPDPVGHAEVVLGLADEFGVGVDLHTDGADPARLTRVAAMAGGLRGRVALGPAAELGRLPLDVAGRVGHRLAASGVRVVCLPQGGCGMSGHGPAPVRMLRAAGVGMAAGAGAIRDAANPVGRADPLLSAYQLVAGGRLGPDEAYAAVAGGARAALGLDEVRVEAGFPADLLAVRGQGIGEALAGACSRIVVHAGRIVSRTSAVREFTDAVGVALPRQGGGSAGG
ncbi:hydrolase [Mangrovactinospora gilvigrisea]|uniref:Hydrolase n=1 Tax=Mangrovactinospora gilvigrisea TaxID=1428644 RepID=A0A1J7CCC6_9ACTN|nr:amidohydrolase family protein [Mangrovactinospora gilvigrisea]OIV39180.1 hydrolase [Mangrovactinospora gilvigrisea]